MTMLRVYHRNPKPGEAPCVYRCETDSHEEARGALITHVQAQARESGTPMSRYVPIVALIPGGKPWQPIVARDPGRAA